MPYSELLAPIKAFLKCETPQAWIDKAIKPENLDIILIDHLICELKAAQSAMFLIRKYAVDKESGNVLLEWLKPFETLVYKREGDWRELADKNKLAKSMIPKSKLSLIKPKKLSRAVFLICEKHFMNILLFWSSNVNFFRMKDKNIFWIQIIL